MPRTPEKDQALAAMRKVVYAKLQLPPGLTGMNEVEGWVRSTARAVLRRCSPAEVQASALEGEAPEWLTEALVQGLFKGQEPERGRVYDLYRVQKKAVLKAEILSRPSSAYVKPAQLHKLMVKLSIAK
eukprot:4501379-Lingulodinium_polyedra.AAC.1